MLRQKLIAGLFGVFIFTSLIGCSTTEDEQLRENMGQGASELYDRAKEMMDLGNFSAAAEMFSNIDSRFPFGPLSHQVQLNLIYCYYKSAQVDIALATIDRFVRLNPNHASVDYALYMRGLTNMEADENIFQDLLNMDTSDRDASKSREAFNDFRNLLNKYPDSTYAGDAKQRMVYIKSRLARYEIKVAQYYMKREAYVAAANRGRYVLENFPDVPQVQQALEIMVASYEQLGLDELRTNAMKTLRLNYPDSEFIN